MQTRKNHTNIIFIIILLSAFAIASVVLAVLGVNIYKTTTGNDARQELDAASLYFAKKIRQCDNGAQLRLAELNGTTPALVLESSVDGKNQETWCFADDGALKELTAAAGSTVSADSAQAVMPLKKADFQIIDNHLLVITLSSESGLQTTVNLYIGTYGEVRHE